MTKWWDDKPDENIYLEVARRDDIGVDLNAPLADRTGAATGGYSLVPLVQQGDLIVHYNSRETVIEGTSVALGPPEPRAVLGNPWVVPISSQQPCGVPRSSVSSRSALPRCTGGRGCSIGELMRSSLPGGTPVSPR